MRTVVDFFEQDELVLHGTCELLGAEFGNGEPTAPSKRDAEWASAVAPVQHLALGCQMPGNL
ncbi:MAG: hypothetical protein AB8G77_12990 [Rhodothermales bacterium]